ncbi:hypothetical protein BOTBODRAFT_69659 [Botryobasidium botryosum FD-172 SS1]|uniref:BTB domain-containing protein n=1 Tax=Botryobasidium botryosum (strain FD-172 SS1) TaxID=930990 RepID=A0A067LZ96_BOTB1|nr:hypothetical protein BOTBODRAFT_69659 [Botryobasidium botryosum FD-172 SS1]
MLKGPDDDAAGVPVHHESLYFEGDLVILALGTPPILLRILRTTLRAHSEVFRDMFSLPANAQNGAEGTTDNNPISLPDDPDAFIYTLKLYHHTILEPPLPPPDFATAVGVFRVSSKYQFHNARDWALKALRSMWSPESPRWLSLLAGSTPGPIEDALKLIEAARETGSTEFLAPAFYLLCVFSDDSCALMGSTILSHSDVLSLLKGSQFLTKAWAVRYLDECLSSARSHYLKPHSVYGWIATSSRPKPNESKEWSKFVAQEATMESVVAVMDLSVELKSSEH